MKKLTCLMLTLASLLLMAAPAAPADAPFREEYESHFSFGSQDQDYTFLCSTIGDSLTGFSALQNVFYDRLNNADYPYRSIPGGTRVNVHSYSGGVTGSVLSMINRYDLGAGEGANFVIIMVGTNDIDYSRHDDLDNLTNGIVANVQAMIDAVAGGLTDPKQRPAIIVAGIPGFTDTDAESRAKHINDQLLARLVGLDVFTDETWWGLYDPNTGTASTSLMGDDKHPNRDGFYIIAEAWFKAVDCLYDSSRFKSDPYLHKMDRYFERR